MFNFSLCFLDIFTNFGNLWSSSLLNTVITDACKVLQKGQALSSLLQLIYNSLRFLLAPFVLQITKMLCSNYSLEPILSINTENPTDTDTQHSELINIILRTVSPPPLVDILKLNVETTISLYRQFAFPPRMAMYDVVSDKLLKILDAANKKISAKIITQNELDDPFAELLENDSIFPAVKFIENNPTLMRLFKEDFVKRTLQMSKMHTKCLDMVVEILDGLCFAREKNGIDGLIFVKYFDEAKMTFLNICLAPLLDLQDPPSLKGLLPEREKIGQMMDTPKKADAIILQLTAKVLWDRLEGLIRAGDEEEKFQNWGQVFCSLRSRLKNRRTVSSLLPLPELHTFDLQMCLYLYCLNFQVSPADTLKDQNTTNVKDVWRTLTSRVNKDTYRGLEAVLPLVTSLFVVVKERATSEQATHYLQDILTYFLNDQENPSAQDLIMVRADTATFMALCGGCLNMIGYKESWDGLWQLVPFAWKTRMVDHYIFHSNYKLT